MSADVLPPRAPLGPVDAVVRDPAAAATGPGLRVPALDALRGLAVVLMLLVNNPGDRDSAPAALRHAEWAGFTPADAVFPLFLFAVGASIPFSRRSSAPRAALRRAGLLALVGLALSSVKQGEPVLAPGVLQHVAGAYLVGWAVTRLPRRCWAWCVVALLAAGWVLYALVGGPGVDPGSYAPGRTPAALVDRVLFGDPHSEGVLATLLSGASVAGGAVVGAAARDGAGALVLARRLAATGTAALAAGLLLTPAVPVVKALWTPSYALLGHAVACLLLAVLLRAAPGRSGVLEAVGANPLAVYVGLTLASLTVLAPVRSLAVPLLDAALPAEVASTAWSAAVAALGVGLALGLRRRGVVVRL